MVVLYFSTSIIGNGPEKPLQTIPSLQLVPPTALQLLEPSHPWSEGKHCAGEEPVPRAWVLSALCLDFSRSLLTGELVG